MWVLLGIALVPLVGCAVVLGEGTATVVNRVETKREVSSDTPVIEEVLLQQALKEKKQ